MKYPPIGIHMRFKSIIFNILSQCDIFSTIIQMSKHELKSNINSILCFDAVSTFSLISWFINNILKFLWIVSLKVHSYDPSPVVFVNRFQRQPYIVCFTGWGTFSWMCWKHSYTNTFYTLKCLNISTNLCLFYWLIRLCIS